MQKLIYMDNAATTRTDSRVREKMIPYFTERYSNPSGLYNFARENKKEIDASRKIIASIINAEPEEIYFTSGGTESDNWVIKNTLNTERKHIITSKIEHHAILNSCEFVEENGGRVTYVDVDKLGKISPGDIEKNIDRDTSLISIITANNEVGTIQNIGRIGEIAHEYDVRFHTDAVQAFGHIPIDVKKMKISMLSASGHKFGGPKGIGFLYINDKCNIKSFIHGGSQENFMRAGTYNVPGIIGMGEAAKIANENMEYRMKYESELRDYIIRNVLYKIPFSRLNGDNRNRLPNNINFSFRYVDGEMLLLMLDDMGICASAGSACNSGSSKPSHVLTAMGLSEEVAYSSIRLTLSHETSREDADYVIKSLINAVEKLRKYSKNYTAPNS